MDSIATGKVNTWNTKCNKCPVRKFSLFKNVAKSRLNKLERYRTSQLAVPAGSAIFLEGEKHGNIYTLFSGWGIIYKTISNNKRQVLRFLLPGDLIGYQVNANGVMSNSAATVTDAVFCTFSRETVKPMLTENPDLAIRLLEMESRDMSLCQNHLIAAGRQSARESISYLLLELFYRVRHQVPENFSSSDNSIYFPITQEDIADAAGLTKVHVNRVIKTLTNEKLIYCHKKTLKIINEEKLCEIADFRSSLRADYPFA